MIDEIDKADPSVPNGLLECLGNEGFATAQLEEPIELAGAPPLVVITTNDERELPAAFLRRCVVWEMRFPEEDDKKAVADFLVERAQVHWGEKQIGGEFEEWMRETFVPVLLRHRGEAKEYELVKPGAAEFLDLVRILLELHPSDVAGRKADFEKVKNFALRKSARSER